MNLASPIDIVYPLKKDVRGDYTDLRYSLRTIHNLPISIRNVWIIGRQPKWAKNVKILNISDNLGDPQKNVIHKLKKVAEQKDISRDFVLMNDDFYFLDKIDDLPFYWHETIGDLITRLMSINLKNKHIDSAVNTGNIFGSFDLPSFSVHSPVILSKSRIRELSQIYDLSQPIHYKTLYANHYKIKGELINSDFKVYGAIPKKAKIVSTATSSAGAMYKVIEQLYPEKSKYEI